MKINVLGISASPRRGNSFYLLDKTFKNFEEGNGSDDILTKIISFQGKKIEPCISCFKCWDKKVGKCILKDDFQDIMDLWLSADVVIYSVPVYHVSISGQLKCFFDRLGNSIYNFYPKTSNKHLKVIGCIAQGMHLHSGQELAIQTVIMHSVLMNCIPISGDGWQSYTGVAGWTDNKNNYNALKELDEKGEVVTKAALEASDSLLTRAVTMAKIIKTGGSILKDELKAEPRYMPFLQRIDD